jgi:hypothetical protein
MANRIAKGDFSSLEIFCGNGTEMDYFSGGVQE